MKKLAKYSGAILAGALDVGQIILVILKFCGVINWDWKIVFLPVEIAFGAFAVLMVISLFCACKLSGEYDDRL